MYIDGLNNILNNSFIGGSLGGKRISHMLYADDLCIVRLSSAGLQKLLSICDEYCASHSITFNVKKSVCMFFKCTVNKHCDNSTVFLNGNQIDFVQEFKYLGYYLILPCKRLSMFHHKHENFTHKPICYYAIFGIVVMKKNVVYSNNSVPICIVVPSGLILHLLVLKNLNVVTTVFYVVCYVYACLIVQVQCL